MIEEPAIVLKQSDTGLLNKGSVRVRVDRTSACESCHLKSGCGQSAMTKLSSNQCIELDVSSAHDVSPGDRVIIAIPEKGLLSASLVVYFVPLVFMLISAILSSAFFDTNDGLTVLFGGVGLVSGFFVARAYGVRHQDDTRFLPEITSVISDE